jgi:hypothetical protein
MAYTIKNKKKIYVGELGDAYITNKKNKKGIWVSYVLEEDGTKSWQLNPDENSDTIIKSAKVIPKEKIE